MALERDLDTLDGLVSAEIQSETVAHFQQASGTAQIAAPRSVKETAGIPTGLAPDLQVQIEKRKEKRLALDNLA